MDTRKYYSARAKESEGKDQYDLAMLRKLFKASFDILNSESYFDEAIGFYCVDQDFIAGYVGQDVELFILKKLRKVNVWPIEKYYLEYTEDDVFDLIELFFDIISKPVDGEFHSWNGCGMHYNKFNRKEGQERFIQEINEFLVDYGDGWELSEKGEILLVGDSGLNNIFNAEIPNLDEGNITSKMNHAIHKFRKHKSSISDRNEAVRELADVLEYIRPQVKEALLVKDERELFLIANSFGIRHHNNQQKRDYDSTVWLIWIFYIYLSTIHLVIRLINKDNY